MKVTNISRKNFERLERLKLGREITNTEGIMYEFNYKGTEKILKRLFHKNGLVFASKLYTIEMLDNNKMYLPDSFCIADSLISVGGVIEGFSIPKFEGVNLASVLKDKSITPEEKIYYLTKIGELLQQLHNIRKYTPLKEIYLNDLHESNFMVNMNKK